mgnify:CR=1 FL=1
MIVPIPNKKEISLKKVEWGSSEFNELIKQAEKQEQEQQEYDQAVEFVTKIMEGY